MNINRDYLIINDVKKSNIKLDNGSMFFYITDKNTQNIFVNLVINVSNNDLIQKYANIENAEDYTLTMNIVKPDNTYKIIEGKLHDKEKAIFEFNLNEDCCDEIGTYRCELLTKCNINDHEEITTSNKLTYKVKSSVLNDLDDIVNAPEYPLVIQLFDKLSDIEQYEEDRRANELARQLAEEQRQTRFNELNTDIDNKMVDVENRISAKEEAVDKLIVDTKADIDEYKVAKDQEIDDYKTAKDAEINNAITVQDNKIDTAISNQNDRITVVENNVVAQNSKLDTLETKATTHEARITATEAKNTEQDSRLDIAENRLANIGNDITNTMQPIIDEHTSRLEAIEAINVAQNTRLDSIEVKNQQQDDRLLDIEKVNNRQDIDIKCLYGASQTIDVTKEGNSIYLQNSNNGFAVIDEIQGNTMVNCNKEADKEIILNGNINTRGYSNVTLTEGVDGGLVDVALEGNTMVNVCDQKDPVAITKSYTVETGNHVALQGEYDGKCRPVVIGNTLVNLAGLSNFVEWATTYGDNVVCPIFHNDSIKRSLKVYANKTYTIIRKGVWENAKCAYYDTNDTCIQGGISSSTYTPTKDGYFQIFFYGTLDDRNEQNLKDLIILEGDYTNKPIPSYFQGLQSSFEDKVVTQEMVDAGEELAENLGKHKVDYVISREDGTVGQTKTFYLNSPLLEGDTIEQQGDNVVHVHRYGKVVFDGSDDEQWKITGTSPLAYLNISNKIQGSNTIICDTLKSTIIAGDSNNTNLGIYMFPNSSGSQIRIRLTTSDTIDSVKQYLQQNPTTVVYKLASPQYEVISQNDTILCDSYVNGHLDVDSVVPIERADFLPFEKDLTYLYANTQYTVQFVSDKAVTVGITLGGAQLLAQSIVKGLNKITITTPSELVDNKLVIDGVGANISKVVVTQATDQEFGYFKGMKSVGECENLEVVSSNSDGTLSNTQTLTHEPLRAVGDVKDKYVLIDGKWYIERNCASVTLDGSDDEGWFFYSIRGNNSNTWVFHNKINYFDYINNSVYYRLLNDKLYTASNFNYNKEMIYGYYYYGSVWIHLFSESFGATKSTPSSDALVLFKQYLSENPITVVGQLMTPVYEPIDYNPFTAYSDITHISNNSTIPCNMVIKNTGYNCLLKPSTTYTVSSNLGLNTVTTPSTLTEDCLRFYDTDTSDVTTMKDVLVLEGDWTTKADLIPANFSGIESAFEQEYDEAVGKYKVKIRVQNEDASKENYIEFYIGEPLRGIGDVKDKVYVKDDKVVVERKCGSVTLDGSNGAYVFSIDRDKLIEFQCRNIIKANGHNTSLCDQFLNKDTFNTEKCIVVNNLIYIQILKLKLQTSDVEGFKQWLQQNPVKVVYQLAEPTYEEVEYNDVKLFIESFKNSTLFYNSNIPVTSKLWYSYSIPLVDTVAQTEDISNQQDSMIIDLATQVAILEMMTL